MFNNGWVVPWSIVVKFKTTLEPDVTSSITGDIMKLPPPVVGATKRGGIKDVAPVDVVSFGAA
jgi:hypothetical protein